MASDEGTQRVCSRCGTALESQNTSGVCKRCTPVPETAEPGQNGTIVLSFADLAAGGREEFPAIGGYEIIELIARGGMGVVYKARDPKLNRIVAIKTMLAGTYASDDFKRRFWREARMAARLHHPNIVPVFEVGEYGGQPYFSMEYVEGTDLGKMTHQQPLRPEEAARYVKAVAEAVHYAHTQGVLHRDLKPSNILVGADDRPRISDFGLARELGGGESSLTTTGALLGSPSYLPPEQASAGHGEVGPASDIYGLGAVLYHLLTGRPPFVASTVPDTLRQLLETEPVAPRKLNLAVPPDLELICLKCLRKRQRDRYQSAEELADDLQRYIESQPVEARKKHLPSFEAEWPEEPAKPESSRASVLWLLLLLAAISVVCWKNWAVFGPYAAAMRDWVAGKNGTNEIAIPANPSPSPVASSPVKPETNSTAESITSGEPNERPQGNLIVHLAEYPRTVRGITDFRCVIQGEGLDKPREESLRGDSANLRLPPGAYDVSLALPEDPAWVLHAPAQVKAGETSRIELRFKYAGMSLVSDPAGANVSWPLWAAPIGQPPPQATPFTNRFRSGAIPFTVTLRGFFVNEVTNYFYPATDNAAQNRFQIALRPRPVPHAGRDWTNSLEMVFRWVKGQQLWACETETRVRDFRAYISEDPRRYDSNPGMSCVTSNGIEQLKCSWENPGPAFAQTDDHPVVGVNWKDATDFCQWLTDHERKFGRLLIDQCYRLPSTKEWVALAGGRRFPWGDDIEPVGNYSGDEVPGLQWPAPWPVLTGHRDAFTRTAPVYCLAFKPNPLGFYHLGGNVAEWCAEKVVLGGSWFDGEIEDLQHLQTVPLNTDLDAPANPEERTDRNGFRVILDDMPLTQAQARETS
jgi:serine/threonine protein kinase/formylglycine-generating enzyme required for sulfatase activity